MTPLPAAFYCALSPDIAIFTVKTFFEHYHENSILFLMAGFPKASERADMATWQKSFEQANCVKI